MTEHTFQYKQAIVVRGDLEMSPAKLAVQVAHASVGAYRELTVPDLFVGNVEAFSQKFLKAQGWFDEGFRKVVLKAPSGKEILELKKKCFEFKIPCFTVYDFGLTELEENTLTCIGIGPDLNKNVDKITGRLRLYK